METNNNLLDIYDTKNWINRITAVSLNQQLIHGEIHNCNICPTCSFENTLHQFDTIFYCNICSKYYNSNIYNKIKTSYKKSSKKSNNKYCVIL
jgi:hypothetical protein